jgi:hypothetical protein
MADIYMPVVECGYVPFFTDVLSIYSCILLFFSLKGGSPTIELALRDARNVARVNFILLGSLKITAVPALKT